MLTFQELKDKYKLNISGIIHIGAHKGTEVDEYINLGVSNIVLFEPIQDVFIELKNNISKYLNCNIITNNVAIGPENGIASLNISTNDKMSSSILKPDKHLSQYPDIQFDSTEEIKVATLDSYNYSTYNFLNIDVQGYELEVLKGSIETLKYVDYIYCEVNRESLYENNAMIDDIDKFLSVFNFKRTETDWFCGTWGEAFYIKEKKEFNWGALPEMDIVTIQREIFSEKVYELFKSVKKDDIVVDIGASVGPFIFSILNNEPQKIYAIEPSSKLIETCRNNIGESKTNIDYINKAVSNNIDKVNIFGGENNFETISFKKLIETYSIDSIDFLKIDCEGGEYDIFVDENINYLKNNVKFIAMEIHLSYPGFREKFKQFRDNYLIHFLNYEVRSCTKQNISYGNSIDLKPYISNDEFIDNYCCEIMIYIDNDLKIIDPVFTNFALDTENPKTNFDLAYYYHSAGHTASAFSHYLRCAERTSDIDLIYECLIRSFYCFDAQTGRDYTSKHLLMQAISLCPNRPEAYYILSEFYMSRNDPYSAYMLTSIAIKSCDSSTTPLSTYVGYNDIYDIYYVKALSSLSWDKRSEYKNILNHIIEHKSSVKDKEKVNKAYQLIEDLEKQQQIHTVYDKSKYSKFKYVFNGLEEIERNYSQCYQDLFILALTNGLKNGCYLEIGAGDPFIGSNTALLEKSFGWKGVSIELDSNKVEYFKQHRSNKILYEDAVYVDYNQILTDLCLTSQTNIIDYLQLDCEPPKTTFETLLQIPFDKYKFKIITYEHDYCVDFTKSYREKSRKYLSSLGYELLVNNISANTDSPFEDWWIYPDCFNTDTINLMRSIKEDTQQAEKYILSQ